MRCLPRWKWRSTMLAATLVVGLGCATPTTPSAVQRFWPLPPDPPRIEYVGQLTNSGDVRPEPSFFRRLIRLVAGEEQAIPLMKPSAVYSDGRGHLYVTDTGLQVVHLFDLEEKRYRQIFRLAGNARLISPVGIAVDEQGRISGSIPTALLQP